MSLGAKIGIVGLGVLALVAGALYYIFVYARNGVNATVTGINRDAAIATNAARDTGEPIAIDPDGTPRYGGLRTDVWNSGDTYIARPYSDLPSFIAPIKSTPVSLAGGAQNNSSLPAITGSSTGLITPDRGIELINPDLVSVASAANINPDTGQMINYNFSIGKDAFGNQVQKYVFDAQGNIVPWEMRAGLPVAWDNLKLWGYSLIPENYILKPGQTVPGGA